MQQIMISHICDLDNIKSKGIITYENLSQVCYMDESESESIIVNNSYT